MADIARSLVSASVLRTAVMALTIGVALLVTPFVVVTLGAEDYGLWVAAAALLNFLNLLDFGVPRGTVVFAGRALEEQDETSVNRTMSSSVAIGVLGLLCGACVLAAFLGLRPYFASGYMRRDEFVLIVSVLGASQLLLLPTLAHMSLLSAQMDNVILSILQAARITIRTLAVLLLLFGDWGLFGMAIATAGADVLVNFGTIIVCHARNRWLRISPGRVSLDTVVTQLKFGFSSLATSLSERFRFSFDTLLIASLVDLTAVAAYSLAVQLATHLDNLFKALLGAFQAALPRLVGRGGVGRAASESGFLLRVSLLLTLPLAPALVMYVDDFIEIWMRGELSSAAPLAALLGVGTLVLGASSGIVSLMFSVGRERLAARLSFLELAGKLILGALLMPLAGGAAFALSYLIVVLATRCVIAPATLRDTEGYDHIRNSVSMLVGLTGALVLGIVLSMTMPQDAGGSVIRMLALATVASSLAIGCSWWIILDHPDRDRILNAILPRFTGR